MKSLALILGLALGIVSVTCAVVHAQEGGTVPVDSALQQLVSERVQVVENKTIFELFAFLNASGYDDENSDSGMHAVRDRLRLELAHLLPPDLQARMRAYYAKHGKSADPYHYSVVAMCTSGPPDFTLGSVWGEVNEDSSFAALSDLPGLLREFAHAAPLDSLYQLVRTDYTDYIDAYRATIVREVAKVMAYCGVPSTRDLSGHGEIARMVVIPNLLQSYENAFSFDLGDTFFSIEGPQHTIGYNPHEFVHSITNQLSYDPHNTELLARAMPLFEAAKTVPAIKDEFASILGFAEENLVRAISLKYLESSDASKNAKLADEMRREYRSGYTLERFYYEGLDEYQKSHRPLRDYYPTMLKKLDAARELAQWKKDSGR